MIITFVLHRLLLFLFYNVLFHFLIETSLTFTVNLSLLLLERFLLVLFVLKIFLFKFFFINDRLFWFFFILGLFYVSRLVLIFGFESSKLKFFFLGVLSLRWLNGRLFIHIVVIAPPYFIINTPCILIGIVIEIIIVLFIIIILVLVFLRR